MPMVLQPLSDLAHSDFFCPSNCEVNRRKINLEEARDYSKGNAGTERQCKRKDQKCSSQDCKNHCVNQVETSMKGINLINRYDRTL
jgi:hypothetical protein